MAQFRFKNSEDKKKLGKEQQFLYSKYSKNEEHKNM